MIAPMALHGEVKHKKNAVFVAFLLALALKTLWSHSAVDPDSLWKQILVSSNWSVVLYYRPRNTQSQE